MQITENIEIKLLSSLFLRWLLSRNSYNIFPSFAVVFWKPSLNSQKNTAMASFFTKVSGQIWSFIEKRMPSQTFSCEFYNFVRTVTLYKTCYQPFLKKGKNKVDESPIMEVRQQRKEKLDLYFNMGFQNTKLQEVCGSNQVMELLNLSL